jgi:hypothetical protein
MSVARIHVRSVYQAKVGEVPTFRSSDTDNDLPIVLTDLFGGFNT